MRPSDPSMPSGQPARRLPTPRPGGPSRRHREGRLRSPRPRARSGAGLVLSVAAALLCAGATVVPLRAGPETDWLPGDYVDYAPAGLPDFSQCRGEWSQPGQPPQWTHAGPVAMADLLWWLDSRAEPDPRPPEQVHDGHGLVTAYPVFGPPRDDHAQANLGPLVLDLAVRSRTNAESGSTWRGSSWANAEVAMRRYVADRGLASLYPIESRIAPDRDWLAEGVANRAGILLLLGVWESQAQGWRRVGGHYAAVAGIDGSAILLADPLADRAGIGGEGRRRPEDPGWHSCREAPAAHDDAAIISHDRYPMLPASELPTGAVRLDGYFDAESYGEAAAFRSLNAADFLATLQGTWQRGTVVMAIDAALALIPIDGPSRTPTPTVPIPSTTSTSEASRTPSATVPPTRSPQPEASASPSATPDRRLSPEPGATRMPDAAHLYLPRLSRFVAPWLW